MRLSERDCERLTDGGKQRGQKKADGNGLYLWATPKGRKVWQLRCWIEGREVAKVLGEYPELGRIEARQITYDYQTQIEKGFNPFAVEETEEEEPNKNPTFREFTEQYIKDREEVWNQDDPKKVGLWSNTMKDYAFPIIGDLPVNEITTQHVLSILKPIWVEKNPTAIKVRGRIEMILGAAKASGADIQHNPAVWKDNLKPLLPHVSRSRRVVKRRALNYLDAPEFMDELMLLTANGPRALQWLIVTGVRSANAYLAQWGEMDYRQQVWAIPATKMKASQPHRVPLTKDMMTFLGAVKEPPERWVFPSPKGEQLSNNTLRATIVRMGWIDRTSVHGWRSVFTDWAREETSYPEAMIRAALAHTEDDVYGRYARGDMLKKRRQMMQDWCDFLGWKPSKWGKTSKYK